MKRPDRALQRVASVLEEQVGTALGPRERGRLWDRHVLDSLTALPLLDGCRTVVDIGSGAGLPGLPLAAAAPWLALTLVEPRAARAAWLVSATDRLELGNVDVVPTRWDASPVRAYDAAVARALAPPERAVAIVRQRPWVRRLLLYVTWSPGLPAGTFTPGIVDSTRGVLDIDLS